MNSGLRKILHKMKLLFLFEKDFDLNFLSKTFVTFSEVYFDKAAKTDSVSKIENAKQVLSIVKSFLLNSPQSNQAVFDTKEYKSMLLNFNIFQKDLTLFCQELEVLEKTIESFLSQVWLLQSQILQNLETISLFTANHSGNFLNLFIWQNAITYFFNPKNGNYWT